MYVTAETSIIGPSVSRVCVAIEGNFLDANLWLQGHTCLGGPQIVEGLVEDIATTCVDEKWSGQVMVTVPPGSQLDLAVGDEPWELRPADVADVELVAWCREEQAAQSVAEFSRASSVAGTFVGKDKERVCAIKLTDKCAHKVEELSK